MGSDRPVQCRKCTQWARFEVTRIDGTVRFYCRLHLRGPYTAVRRVA